MSDRAEVRFFDRYDGDAVRLVVTAARCRGRWVFCRHRARATWELPGGHREPGETALEAARRELWEETGAERFTLRPVCCYRVYVGDGAEPPLALLCFAEVECFGPLPPFEMAEMRLGAEPPGDWTYPEIVPHLRARIEADLAAL